MSPWTRLLAVAWALGGLLLATGEARNRRGSGVLVPPGAYCGPCDVRACPNLQAESCPGLVVKDECNCCPVCPVNDLTTDNPLEDLNFTSSKNESGCASIKCPRMQICVHNIQGLPLCRCPSVYHCRQFKRKPLCGRDRKTYKNRCYLQMTECAQGKKIRVAYMSKCKEEDGGVAEPDRKEERKKKRKERRKNRKRIKKQRRKDRFAKGKFKKQDDNDDIQPPSEITPPNLPPHDPRNSADNKLNKLSAKEKRRQRRKERQKKRKLKRREKRRRQRRRLRRSCEHEPV